MPWFVHCIKITKRFNTDKVIKKSCSPEELKSKIDFAFLPIGDNFTMGVDNAIICCKDFINCSDVIGMHYDTFGFIKIDKEEAKQKLNINF